MSECGYLMCLLFLSLSLSDLSLRGLTVVKGEGQEEEEGEVRGRGGDVLT